MSGSRSWSRPLFWMGCTHYLCMDKYCWHSLDPVPSASHLVALSSIGATPRFEFYTPYTRQDRARSLFSRLKAYPATGHGLLTVAATVVSENKFFCLTWVNLFDQRYFGLTLNKDYPDDTVSVSNEQYPFNNHVTFFSKCVMHLKTFRRVERRNITLPLLQM